MAASGFSGSDMWSGEMKEGMMISRFIDTRGGWLQMHRTKKTALEHILLLEFGTCKRKLVDVIICYEHLLESIEPV